MSAGTEILAGGNRLAGFAGWWLVKLAGILNNLLDHHRPWKALILADRDEVSIFVRRKAKPVHLAIARIAPDNLALRSAADQLHGLNISPKSTLLRLRRECVISETMILPATAAEYVDAIIYNKLERLAPWPPSEAIYGYEITPSEAGEDQIVVRLVITGRAIVDEILQEFRQAGIDPGAIDAAQEPDSTDAVPLKTQNDDRLASSVRSIKTALAIICLIAIAVGGVGLYRYAMAWLRSSEADAQITQLQVRGTISTPSTPEEELLTAVNNAIARKRQQPAFVVTLDVLTKALPDDAWITELDYKPPAIIVSGNAKKVPGLIDALESTSVFVGVKFSAPTIYDAGQELSSFSISATIEQQTWQK